MMLVRVSALLLVLGIPAAFGGSDPYAGANCGPGSPCDHFANGSIGAELVPLPAFMVLPDLDFAKKNFQPEGPGAGDWIDQFGLVRRDCKDAERCLPFGLTASNHDPRTGEKSKLPFVGLTCALCHTGQLRLPQQTNSVVVSAMGNPDLDLVAFGDAVRSSVLDPRLTTAVISDAYRKKFGRSLTILEKGEIEAWLNGVLTIKGIRQQIRDMIPITGSPYGGAQLHDARFIPSGPGRIMATRDTIRRLTKESPYPDGGPSKLPALYQQQRRHWAQFDGSVKDPDTRNSIAALGVGSSMARLKVRDILANIRQSTEYLRTLPAPRFKDAFPTLSINETWANDGRKVYHDHCASCHGEPGATPGEWIPGKNPDDPVCLTELGTDPARVSPRFYDELADKIYNDYPPDHPLKPRRDELRVTHGYMATPLEGLFTRAPYLHNGSVPTLAELINLVPRRAQFYRGAAAFDADNIGIQVGAERDPHLYYRFDTSLPGNSNKGHDYPWPYKGSGWNEPDLRNLLEYLKTL